MSSLALSSWVQFDGAAMYLLATSAEGMQEWTDFGSTKNGSSASGTADAAVRFYDWLQCIGSVLIPPFHMCLFEFIFLSDLKS